MAFLRKIVFLVFVLIYAFVAPFTILYALGYIFQPDRPTLLQTGLVSLISQPSQARVWVNGLTIQEKTPLVLRNLKPGTYQIRIERAGYQPWARPVSVAPERAIRLEKILLFPARYRPSVLGGRPVTQIRPIPKTRNFLIQYGDTASGLFLFDLDKDEPRPLLPQAAYADAKVEAVSFNPSGDRALLGLRKARLFLPVLVRFESLMQDSIQTEEPRSLFPEPFEHLQWNPALKDSVYYLKGNTLKRSDLDSGLTFPELAGGVRGFALYARRLFVLDEKGRFLELSEKGKIRDIFLDEPAQSRLIFGSMGRDFYSIHFLPRESLFFLPNDTIAIFFSREGRLVSNRLPYFLDEGVQEISLAFSESRLAYRKGSGIWTVDFEKERERTFFENGPTPRKIYEGRESISNLWWFHEDQYLLFREGNRLRVQDFEGEEKPVELFRISSRVQDVALDEKRGFVYFADPETDYLSRVKVFEP